MLFLIVIKYIIHALELYLILKSKDPRVALISILHISTTIVLTLLCMNIRNAPTVPIVTSLIFTSTHIMMMPVNSQVDQQVCQIEPLLNTNRHRYVDVDAEISAIDHEQTSLQESEAKSTNFP